MSDVIYGIFHKKVNGFLKFKLLFLISLCFISKILFPMEVSGSFFKIQLVIFKNSKNPIKVLST